MISTLPASVDPKAIQEVLDGRWAHVRRDARENLYDPDFLPVYGENVPEARERVTRAAKKLAASGRVGLGFPKEYGGEDDAGGSVDLHRDARLRRPVADGEGRRPVGPVRRCAADAGQQRQHEKYLRDVMSFDLPGCFAMTETGHGSDVQQLRTTCTYDPATETFDLHTPHQAARKDYIGNAAKDGRMAVVFAQLITRGKNHGVHAWLVPIRSEDGTPCPGVTIGDDGAKAGLNGVDNGRLTFDHVTVPRDMLLDRYGQVAADGTYTSSIENETRRFFTMLGTLVRGRVSVGGSGCVGDQAGPRHRRPLRRRPPPVRRPGRRPRDRHQRLPGAPAQAAAGAGHHLRAALRAGPAGRDDARRPGGGDPRRGGAARAGVAGRGPQGRPDLARHPHHPALPRGLRRRGLPAGEPAAAPQGRHRRLHHVRGRQHRPAAAGRQGPAHRLPRRVRLPGGLGQGRLHRRHGPRDRAGADGGPRADRAARRRRPQPERRRDPDAHPRLAAEDDRVPREARARGRDPAAAEELHDRGHGPVRHVQRRPGPRAEDGADAHRPGRPGGVRRRRRPDRPTPPPRSSSTPSATSTRSPRSRRTRPGSSSTASSPRLAPSC